MNLNRINTILAILLAVIFVLLMLIRVDNSQPNYIVRLGDDMASSPAYTTYEANDNFPNGRTLQEPVPGTIARGSKQIHFVATPEGAKEAGEQLVNPFTAEQQMLSDSVGRGKVAYQTFCVACHAADGAGNGLVAQRGFPPPPSLLAGKSREMKDGQLFHILTYGQNSMPQFAAQLTHDHRWDVVNHIRHLQSQAPSPIVNTSTHGRLEYLDKTPDEPSTRNSEEVTNSDSKCVRRKVTRNRNNDISQSDKIGFFVSAEIYKSRPTRRFDSCRRLSIFSRIVSAAIY